MQKPTENNADPQQQGEWQGAPRPEGAWGAAREEKACGRTVMPATQRPLVPQGRPWLPANPVPSAPEAGEDEEVAGEEIAKGDPLIEPADVAEVARKWEGEGNEREGEAPGLQAPSREQFFDQISQNTEAMRDMIRAVRDMLEAQTRGLQQAPAGSIPGAFPSAEPAAAPAAGGGGDHPDLPVIVDESDVSGAEAAVARAREEQAAKQAHRTSILETVLASMARTAASAAVAGVEAVGAGAASAVRSLLAPDEGAGAAGGEQPPSIYMSDEEEPAPTPTRRQRRNADDETVREGAAWVARRRGKK